MGGQVGAGKGRSVTSCPRVIRAANLPARLPGGRDPLPHENLSKGFYTRLRGRCATVSGNRAAGPVMPVPNKLLAPHPISPGTVELTRGFSGDRQLQNRQVSIPYGMKMMEESGTPRELSLGWFRWPERPVPPASFPRLGPQQGPRGRCVGTCARPGADQEKFFRSSTELIAAAQEPDGYLNTYVRVVQHGHRFQDAAMGHELYCAGHLFQAAVADARTAATGPVLLGPIVDRYASMLVDVLRSEQAGLSRAIPRSRRPSSSSTALPRPTPGRPSGGPPGSPRPQGPQLA
jgi:hypothetical protein